MPNTVLPPLSPMVFAKREGEEIVLELPNAMIVLSTREAADLRSSLWTALYADPNGHTTPIRFQSSTTPAEVPL